MASYIGESLAQLVLIEKEELWSQAEYRQHHQLLLGIYEMKGDRGQAAYVVSCPEMMNCSVTSMSKSGSKKCS